jgi:uncharacterized protein
MADPIHGLLQFDRDNPAHAVLLAVMNTRAFQRLRRIKQMGLAEFVFPGATHSRFIHSLGATHLMMRALAQLHRMEDTPLNAYKADTYKGVSVELLALVGILVHDIGHPPFSHTLESAIQLEQFNALHDQYWNARILREDPELVAVWATIDPNFVDILLAFLGHGPDASTRHPLAALIAGQLDLDRLDYLQRDSHFLGVQYGRIETERLLMNLEMAPLPSTPADAETQPTCTTKQWVVAVREEALPAVEHYLFGRHQAYKMAMHPLDKAAEILLKLTLRRFAHVVNHGGLSPLPNTDALRLFTLITQPTTLSIGDYLRLDDGTLWGLFQEWAANATDPLLASLAERLLRHDLPKFIDLRKYEPTGTLADLPTVYSGLQQAYKDHGIDWDFGFEERTIAPKPLYQTNREPIWISTGHHAVDISQLTSLPLDLVPNRGIRHLVFVWDKPLKNVLTQLLTQRHGA